MTVLICIHLGPTLSHILINLRRHLFIPQSGCCGFWCAWKSATITLPHFWVRTSKDIIYSWNCLLKLSVIFLYPTRTVANEMFFLTLWSWIVGLTLVIFGIDTAEVNEYENNINFLVYNRWVKCDYNLVLRIIIILFSSDQQVFNYTLTTNNFEASNCNTEEPLSFIVPGWKEDINNNEWISVMVQSMIIWRVFWNPKFNVSFNLKIFRQLVEDVSSSWTITTTQRTKTILR